MIQPMSHCASVARMNW